jgi:hypothetical protein
MAYIGELGACCAGEGYLSTRVLRLLLILTKHRQ